MDKEASVICNALYKLLHFSGAEIGISKVILRIIEIRPKFEEYSFQLFRL